MRSAIQRSAGDGIGALSGRRGKKVLYHPLAGGFARPAPTSLVEFPWADADATLGDSAVEANNFDNTLMAFRRRVPFRPFTITQPRDRRPLLANPSP
jgi:hypothetical protein